MQIQSTRRQVFEAIKAARAGKDFSQPEVTTIDALLDQLSIPREGMISADPSWIACARTLLGQREIPGPQHAGWIAKGWARLGAGWFNDDETPWCGFFVAHCLNAAGLPYPAKGEFARALRWATWGSPIDRPVLGAIGVKSRKGGGHVFFIVGETADKRSFKALGGNQSNMVSIIDIAKADVVAIRWPQGAPVVGQALPVLAAGPSGGSEA